MDNTPKARRKPIDNSRLVKRVEIYARTQGVRPAKLAVKAGWSTSAWSQWKLNKTHMREWIADEIVSVRVPAAVREWASL